MIRDACRDAAGGCCLQRGSGEPERRPPSRRKRKRYRRLPATQAACPRGDRTKPLTEDFGKPSGGKGVGVPARSQIHRRRVLGDGCRPMGRHGVFRGPALEEFERRIRLLPRPLTPPSQLLGNLGRNEAPGRLPLLHSPCDYATTFRWCSLVVHLPADCEWRPVQSPRRETVSTSRWSILRLPTLLPADVFEPPSQPEGCYERGRA